MILFGGEGRLRFSGCFRFSFGFGFDCGSGSGSGPGSGSGIGSGCIRGGFGSSIAGGG